MSFYRLCMDISMMQHHNLLAKAEANSTSAFFSAEKRDEDFVEHLTGHARPVIGNLYDDFFITIYFSSQDDPRIFTVFHGINTIDNKINQYLLHEGNIGL